MASPVERCETCGGDGSVYDEGDAFRAPCPDCAETHGIDSEGRTSTRVPPEDVVPAVLECCGGVLGHTPDCAEVTRERRWPDTCDRCGGVVVDSPVWRLCSCDRVVVEPVQPRAEDGPPPEFPVVVPECQGRPNRCPEEADGWRVYANDLEQKLYEARAVRASTEEVELSAEEERARARVRELERDEPRAAVGDFARLAAERIRARAQKIKGRYPEAIAARDVLEEAADDVEDFATEFGPRASTEEIERLSAQLFAARRGYDELWAEQERRTVAVSALAEVAYVSNEREKALEAEVERLKAVVRAHEEETAELDLTLGRMIHDKDGNPTGHKFRHQTERRVLERLKLRDRLARANHRVRKLELIVRHVAGLIRTDDEGYAQVHWKVVAQAGHALASLGTGPCPTCDGRGWHTAGGNDPSACGRCPAGEAWATGEGDRG